MTTDAFTHSDESDDFDPFAGGEISKTAPMTPEQEELWLSVQLGGTPANLAYNQTLALSLRGDLDASALRASLATLIERHEALRTTVSGDGRLLCVAARGEITLRERDLAGLDESARQKELERVRQAAVQTPFDLVRGPLFAAELVRLGAREHLLLLCAHHIILDGWSASLLADELGKLYSAERRGEAANLPPAMPFSEYAVLRAHEAETEAGRADVAFWRDRYRDLPPPLDLPLTRPRPAERTFDGDRVDLPLSEDLISRLTELAAEQGTSLATVLFAAFQVLIHRLTGQRRLAIVMPAAGQSIVGEPALLGHCVRSLPIACELDGATPFTTHLAQVKRSMLDAFEHPRLTFGGLLQQLSVPREPSRIPLTPVMFNVESSAPPRFEGLDGSVGSVPRPYESFELFVSVGITGKSASLEAQFGARLFDRQSIARRLAEYVVLLEDVLCDPKRPVGELSLMPEAERKALFAAMFAGTTEPVTETACALFRDSAAQGPGVFAVTAGGRTLSYAELDRKSAALAQELVARGFGTGSMVGVFASRSVELPVALLGILRAGAAYVPLDPEHPRERLEFLVSDAKVGAIVTEQALLSRAPRGPRCFLLDVEREDATSDIDNSRLEEPAYVIYTSGSTGRPKGVVVLHRNVANLFAAMQDKPGLGPSDVVLAVTTPCFDISVPELLLPLTLGARVVIALAEEVTDGRRLAKLVENARPTYMQATPAGFRVLLEAGFPGAPGLTAMVGGEALKPELAAELRARTQRLWNGYGPTEATVWATMEDVREGPIMIGRPIANTSAYVLDEARRPVAPGVTGELYLGGAGVARGYLDRPELTRERFLPDPFSSVPDARMYKTGDLARFHWDGRLEWLGRSDFQVKVRGYRIELGEIEAHLSECAGVSEAVAVVREDRRDDPRIVAYVRPRPGAEPSEERLRAELKERLPSYMLPQHFVLLSEFPLNANGKLDRAALPAPEASAPAAYREPQSEIERELAAAIAELVGVPRVGLDDDFFALGGHSMSALRLCARVRRQYGVDVPVRAFFAAPTLKGVASFVEAALLVRRGSGVRTAHTSKDREEVLL